MLKSTQINSAPGLQTTIQQLGSYRLIRLLRCGGYATLYLGEHRYLKTQVVLKLLNTWYATESDVRSLLSEARLHACFPHTHIVRVLDFGKAEDIPFMVIDYAPHGTLHEHFPQQRVVTLQVILPYVLQVGLALQYLHDADIVHGDVKPQNILLGPNFEAWLCDFGAARSVTQSLHLGDEQIPRGTVLYAAPEQIRGRPEPASDQYALGVMLYTWLCGHYPFQGSATQICHQHLYAEPKGMRAFMPEIPDAIEQVILRSLAKEPSRRFSCIATFMDALQQATCCPAFRHRTPLMYVRSLLTKLLSRENS
ncbi:serine/threonine protein kinase [Ktedonospora formicarum]|uniref:Protein kinase domain-containing protein n=1 Tax=Ktedonospora formicarum TaxID=2778364 RepID=A0A8J3HXR1_9CHLR|nr:serine/threonine-protein kinase [Ktedonospora formicarum]GHO43921.1 hypothetical protein KSX_20840 [Ktedonospora formicarum]